MNSYPCFIALIFATIFFLACNPTSIEKEAKTSNRVSPNILLIIADDWSFPHAGFLGDPVVRTPTFDELAKNGTWFRNAFVASPSCSPSRASILNGRYPHQNGGMGNLWSTFTKDFPIYTDLLSTAGYHVGSQMKGWGPGLHPGYEHNPAGKSFGTFKEFLSARKDSTQPFCYWFGSFDPHRVYEANSGVRAGMSLEDVVVPSFLPDNDCVRGDILDYFFEVERFDRMAGALIKTLEASGELDNTLVIVTSDNGMPFPRAKATLYDYGTRVPLVIHWPEGYLVEGERTDFASLIDLAPTILEAAGLSVPEQMHGKSLLPVLRGDANGKGHVYLERERHANVRKGNLSYPMRAIRNDQYLFIRNFEPDRWPAGDPVVHQSVGQYGDIDNSISKFLIESGKDNESAIPYFDLAFSKRPAYELYQIENDPGNINNLAQDPKYQDVRAQLEKLLNEFMRTKNDPRYVDPNTIFWDTVTYVINDKSPAYDAATLAKNWELEMPRKTNRLSFQKGRCE